MTNTDKDYEMNTTPDSLDNPVVDDEKIEPITYNAASDDLDEMITDDETSPASDDLDEMITDDEPSPASDEDVGKMIYEEMMADANRRNARAGRPQSASIALIVLALCGLLLYLFASKLTRQATADYEQEKEDINNQMINSPFSTAQQLDSFSSQVKNGAIDIEGKTSEEILEAFQKAASISAFDDNEDDLSGNEIEETQSVNDSLTVWTADSEGTDTSRKDFALDTELEELYGIKELSDNPDDDMFMINLAGLDQTDVGFQNPFSEIKVCQKEEENFTQYIFTKKI